MSEKELLGIVLGVIAVLMFAMGVILVLG